MIQVKDTFAAPRKSTPAVAIDLTSYDAMLVALSVISVIVSIVFFLLNLGNILFCVKGGEYVMALLYILAMAVKHVSQLLWFLQLFSVVITGFGKWIKVGISGAGLLLVGGFCVYDILKLYSQNQNMIEAVMHPFVFEAGTFVIADIFLVIKFINLSESPSETPAAFYAMPIDRFYKPSVPQTPAQVEMSSFPQQAYMYVQYP